MNDESTRQIQDKILQFGSRAVELWQNEKVESLTPARTDNYLAVFSAYGAVLEEEMGKLTMDEALVWVEIRKSCKTNSEADKTWQASQSGQRQIQLKFLLRAVDKVIAACKVRMRRFESEGFNRY